MITTRVASLSSITHPAFRASFCPRTVRLPRVRQRQLRGPRALTVMAGSQWTVLDAINVAKVATAGTLVACAAKYGIHDARQTLYLGLHMSYLTYWYLHQVLIPEHKQFNEPANPVSTVLAVLLIGFGYAYPGYLAFTNETPISAPAMFLSIWMFATGTAVNVASDMYKAGAKAAGAGLVKSGPFRLAVKLNYFGDIMRYSSFAVASGHLASFGLPLFVAFINISDVMTKQIESQKKRYGDEFIEYASTTPMLVPFTWPMISGAKQPSKKA